jgi:hypothetical protein
MAWLLVGSIPGVLIGSQISIRIPERGLRVAFAFILVLSGIKLLELPAATTIVEIGGALGIAAFLVWIARSLRGRRLAAAAEQQQTLHHDPIEKSVECRRHDPVAKGLSTSERGST